MSLTCARSPWRRGRLGGRGPGRSRSRPGLRLGRAVGAAGLGTVGRLRHALDGDVVVPGGSRHLRAGLHHAAAWRAAGGEGLIGAHRAHIDRAVLGPTEEPRVERELAIEIAGVELVPADMTWRHWRNRLGFLLGVRLEEQEHAPAGIGNTRKAPKIGKARGSTLNRA